MANLKIKAAAECFYDGVALGEVMLRLDPGDGRIHTTRLFKVWEGGGEYNVARGLRRCFGLKTAVVTSLVDNPVGRLVEDFEGLCRRVAGAVAQAESVFGGDVARTSDATFRPIALAMGPDGALYVADWTNPIINHGEVDFRDPRRDKEHGRIWRIAPKGSKPLAWQPVAGQPVNALLEKLLSPNRWDFEAARRELAKVPVAELQKALVGWVKDETTRRHAAWLLSARTGDTKHLVAMLDAKSSDNASVQVALRELGKAQGHAGDTDIRAIAPFVAADQHPPGAGLAQEAHRSRADGEYHVPDGLRGFDRCRGHGGRRPAPQRGA
jgi:hypothetical protein